MTVGAFLGIFALIFVLELPDKTMIATIVMSTRARSSSIVMGASAGFVVQMGIAVGAGGLLTLLPLHAKDVIVAVLFLGGAAYLLLTREEKQESIGEREAEPERSTTRLKEITTAFTVIFLAEFGDLTQIQAANFTVKTHQPLEVFLAASLALICVSFLGAYGGRFLQRYIPLRWIRYGGGLIFLGLGIYTLVNLATS
ncbi:MAG TPA: TMEM165/GDT1 family protein [Acidimicrobiales bacterium]|jgi:Ca2+/H+ antiporter, TMEM165/GDT1 family|nr:TMEM165/GDT1 family protein [Acidimicrobiales bacterium]